MKEITRKILESGLVDKHTAQLLEKWGTLEPGASDIVGKQQVTKETMQALADDIAQLLGGVEPIRETVLDDVKGERIKISTWNRHPPYDAVLDELGNIIVTVDFPVSHGDEVFVHKESDSLERANKVMSVDPLYVGEKIVAKRLSISPLKR